MISAPLMDSAAVEAIANRLPCWPSRKQAIRLRTIQDENLSWSRSITGVGDNGGTSDRL